MSFSSFKPVVLTLCLALVAPIVSQAHDRTKPVPIVAKDDKRDIAPSKHPIDLTIGAKLNDVTYSCAGMTCNLADFMRRNRVCALLVMKDRQLRMEQYNGNEKICRDPGQTNNAKRLYGIASVTKSITSTLLGFALMKGATPAEGIDFSQLDRAISDPLPELDNANSAGGFSGVSIDQVLRMRSGIDYAEYGGDADRLREEVFSYHARTSLQHLQLLAPRTTFLGGPAIGRFNYAGANTQALGLLVERLTNRPLIEYIYEKLWEPLGMSSRARWLVDKAATPAAYCCFSATGRDLLRFGQFVLDKGRNLNDVQLLPPEWFARATRPVAGLDDHIPWGNESYNGKCPKKAPHTYRYQWWLFDNSDEFTAIGIDGQFIHLVPRENLVIVQISDWPDWKSELECEAIDFHAAIVRALAD